MKWIALILWMLPIAVFADDDSRDLPNGHPEITIIYGSDVTENMDALVEALASRGIEAVAISGLDNPNCAAIIFRGEEQFRYSNETILNGQLGSTAIRLVHGRRIGRRSASDCAD